MSIDTNNDTDPAFDPTNGKKKELVYFTTERLILNSEVNRHPELCALLTGQPQEWSLQLAEIAAYCNVWLEGDYYQGELDKLYVILRDKLAGMRAPIHLQVKNTGEG